MLPVKNYSSATNIYTHTGNKSNPNTQASFENSIASQAPQKPKNINPWAAMAEKGKLQLQKQKEDMATTVAAAEAELNLRPENEVPARVTSWWLHKSEDETSDIPQKIIDNELHNATINPQYNFVLKSDNPQRIKERFPEKLPANLSFQQERFNFGSEFPKTELVARGIVEQIPQMSKDLVSYKLLQDNPGLIIDPDTRLTEPMPYPLRIKGNVAAHMGYENSVIAYSGSKKDLMTPLLHKIENNTDDVFNFISDKNKTMVFPNKNTHFQKTNIVDMLQFNDYVKTVKSDGSSILNDYIKYDAPPSDYSAKDKYVSFFTVEEK